MYRVLVIPLLIISFIVPSFAQLDIPEIEPIRGIPEEKIECILDKGECLPNKRIIVYAVYDDTTNQGKAESLELLLRSQETLKQPRVVEEPISIYSNEKYTYVTASFEFGNNESNKIDNIKFLLGRDAFFSDAAFIRVTIFDTWHNFDEEYLRPCELIQVIEFGDPSVLVE